MARKPLRTGYADQLRSGIEELCPPALFENLLCHGNTQWTPARLLLHLCLNALWDFRTGPGTASERRHLEEMVTSLPPGSLIAADAGFIGYELCQRLQAARVSFLLRVGGNLTLLVEQMGAVLRREGDLVWLWPSKFRSQPPLVLRLMRRGRGSKAVFLLTDVREPSRLSAKQAGEIDRRRWGIEVAYRTIKQTFDRREWLSRTPRTVLAEHTAAILGLWILQVLSLSALRHAGRPLREWSPSGARDVTRRALRLALDPTLAEPITWRMQLGQSVRDNYVRHRPKRSRSWPHKKHDPPVRPPRRTPLTPQLRLQGQTLLDDS